MAEGHRDEARAGLDPLAAGAALHEAGVAVQVGEPLRHSVVVGAQGGGANLRRADRVEQGDRLRRGEAHVVAEDRLVPPLATRGVGEDAWLGPAHEDFSGAGVPAGEYGGIVVAVDLAVQAQLCGQLADPLAGRLARLRVVVLAAFGDGFDPVARVPAPDLRHSHHTSVVQRERLLHRPNCRVPSVSGCWRCGCGGASRRAGPMKRFLTYLPLRLDSLPGVLALAAWLGSLGLADFFGESAAAPPPPTYPQNSAAEAAVKGARARPPQGVDGRRRGASIERRAGVPPASLNRA